MRTAECGGSPLRSIHSAKPSCWWRATSRADSEARSYRSLIKQADARFDAHLAALKAKRRRK